MKLVIEGGAPANEITASEFQQASLFFVQAQGFRLLVQNLYTLENRLIQIDRIIKYIGNIRRGHRPGIISRQQVMLIVRCSQ